MIALLDFIEANTDPSNPAQVHAREWAAASSRAAQASERAVRHRPRLSDVGKLEDVLREHGAISAELASLCHRQMEFVSRIRPSHGDTSVTLAEKIVALIDEDTDELCPEDTFTSAGAALAEAIDALDSRYADHCFRKGIADCIGGRNATQ